MTGSEVELPPDPARSRQIDLVLDGTMQDAAVALSPYLRVVVPESKQGTAFKGRFLHAHVDDVLRVMAGTMGELSMVRQREGFVYVGPPTDQDRVSAVYAVPSGDGSDWAGLYQLGGTAGSEVRAQGDLVIVRDTVQGLKRVSEIHRAVSRSRRQYTLECCFLELTDDQLDQLGVTVTASGTSTLTLKSNGDLSLDAMILAQLQGSKNHVRSSQVQNCRLHLVEGSEESEQLGDEVNVPRKSVSDFGTVTTTGYDRFQTGVTVTAKARTIVEGMIRLDLTADLSDLVGITNDLPQITHRKFTSSAFLGSGGVLVLGGVETRSSELSGSAIPGTGLWSARSARDRMGKLYLLVRLKEI